MGSRIQRPLLLLELDDSSHNRDGRRARDAFVDRAVQAAGLPILHVKAAGAYAPRALAAEMAKALRIPAPSA